MTSPDRSIIRFRIICLHPPPTDGEGQTVQFGLQDKANHLHAGNLLPDGSLAFECDAHIKQNSIPDFTGPYIHGSPAARFLYLSLGQPDGETWRWVKRIKVSLKGITAAQLQAAHSEQGYLEATVDGRGAATVPLIGGGWKAF